MSKNIAKLLSLFLVSFLVISSFSACKGNKKNEGTDSSAKSTTSAAKATGSAAKATGSAAKATGTESAATDSQGNPIDTGETGEVENPGGNEGGGEVVVPPTTDDTGIQKVDVDMKGYTVTFTVRLASVDSMPKGLLIDNPEYTEEEWNYTKEQAIASAQASQDATGIPDTRIYNLLTGKFSGSYLTSRQWYEATKKYNFTVNTISESSHANVVNAINSNYAANTYYADVGLVNTKVSIPFCCQTGSLVAWEDVGFDCANDPRLNCNDWVYTCGMWKNKHYGFNKPNTAENALFYNLDLFNQLGLPDLHQFVWNNTWSWNTFLDIAKAGTLDLNSDGVMDIYGVIGNSPGETGDTLAVSNGIIPISYNRDTGNVDFMLNTQAGVRALQFMSQLVNTDKVITIPSKNGSDLFVAGGGCMLIGYSTASVQHISENIKYGWAPMPMGPDATKYLAPRSGIDEYSVVSGQTYSNVLPFIVAEAVCTWDTTKEFSIPPESLVSDLYKVGDKIQRQEDVEICKAFLGAPTMTFSQSFSSAGSLITSNIYTPITSMTITPRSALDQYSGTVQAKIDEICGQ